VAPDSLIRPVSVSDDVTQTSINEPRGSLDFGRYSRRPFLFSLVGAVGILSFGLYGLLDSYSLDGHQGTARFLLLPQLLAGSLALVGSLIMRTMPARFRDAGFLVAASGIASAFFGYLSFPIEIAAASAILGGFMANQGGSRGQGPRMRP